MSEMRDCNEVPMKDRQGSTKIDRITSGHRIATEAFDSAAVHFWKVTPEKSLMTMLGATVPRAGR
ncbi:hypothetical protein [Bradyrhizobium sp.]|jgi:hypothetical protein|uniref:hypothetical protein n=1 Tax=Bradyrhizobium sp. TaxID=376 RepID=UPI003BB1F6C3